MTDKPLLGRIVVVTGASRGIGRAAALGVAAAGAHVVAVARTVGGLEELDDAIRAVGGEATLVPLDLKDFPAIDRLGAALYERYGKLDGLVGNAGVLGPISPVGHVDPKDFDEVLAVNVTANYRLIRSLDPLLRLSGRGRAVFLSSGAVRNLRPFWGAYSLSKAALEALVVTYARESETHGIKANLVNPGPMRTKMRAKAMPGEDPETLPAPEALVPHIVRLLGDDVAETGRVWDFPKQAWL
ncbi:SDR family NAD(P)-dependent oxidoreductase [Methyloraptor flagellatus]|uniref:SDR family NAD(P)-dependent oxidoreductase n=1 Tax=Methyloraptor flagellatus TaxID=3162530 RepID=A0AAU7XFX3_9HYPH